MAVQLPLFVPECSWQAPAMSSLPSWKGAKRIGFDLETKDPLLKKLGCGARRPGGHVVGISFAIEDGPSFYLPIRHEGGDNMDAAQVLGYVREQAASYEGEIVGANIAYDLDWGATEGITFDRVKRIRDVQVAEALVDELQGQYSLEAIAQRHLGIGKAEGLLREAAAAYGLSAKKELWALPGRFVGEYGDTDAVLPLRILRLQERLIDEQDLWRIYDLESRLTPVLVRMRQRGVRVDQDRLAKVEAWCLAEERKALAALKHEVGVTVSPDNVMNSALLEPVFQAMGVPMPRTPKTNKPSVNKAWLASVKHPALVHLERARRINKVRATFVQSVREHMVNGRVHCSYNQTITQESEEDGVEGAGYGRLSCKDPNMQQQPARDPELGPMWRSIYVPDEGGLWASEDYSQQEPRLVVHYAELSRLEGAQEAGDRYRNDPSTDSHQMFADMAGIPRKAAKNIYLGITYGMGGPKLCRSLELPTKMGPHWKTGELIEMAGDEGQALMDKVDRGAPFLRQLAKRCTKRAERKGFIVTVGGRHCRFPRDSTGRYDWTHKALNRLIQGSAGDQTKKAMVDADEAGFALQLQVHDELDLTVADREEAMRLKDIMEHCVKLTVPSKVDVEIGPSWGEAK